MASRPQLRGTERRWQELRLLLGKPLPGPPVKLDADVEDAAGAAAQQPRRSAGPGYLTGLMSPR